MGRILVIVPTYNERENIRLLVEEVLSLVPSVDLMLVDDASPDGTADVAEQLFGCLPNFSVLRRTGCRGLGPSYVEAFQVAVAHGYSRIVQMDADLSHDPKQLMDLVRATESADVAIGSRYCTGGGVHRWPIHRLVLSQGANAYIRATLRLPVHDATSGYRCYTRRALSVIHLDRIESTGFAFQVEMIHRAHCAGLRIVEVPILFGNRCRGRSKMSGRMISEMARLPFRLRSQIAMSRSPEAGGRGPESSLSPPPHVTHLPERREPCGSDALDSL
jgi:dolichol-phosphate mannosyltransferase